MKLGLIVIAMRQHGPHIAKILARQALAEAQHLHARTGRRGLRHRRPRARQSAAAVQEHLRHRAPGPASGLTAHAGEDAPAPSTSGRRSTSWGRTRIGHGCSAASDQELLRRMARDQIVVECCLSSNEHTGAVKRGTRHPIHAVPRGRRAGRPLLRQHHGVAHRPAEGERPGCARARGRTTVEEIHRRAQSYTFIKPGARAPRPSIGTIATLVPTTRPRGSAFQSRARP